MGARCVDGAAGLSARLVEIAEDELEAIRQDDFEHFLSYIADRQTVMDTLERVAPKNGERELVVASLKRVQTIDREIEVLVGALREETRRAIEDVRAGRRLLHQYSMDLETQVVTHLDVKG